MPDICMCYGGECPQKKECYCYLAKPDQYRQSYFTTPPVREDGTCQYFDQATDHMDECFGRGYSKAKVRG